MKVRRHAELRGDTLGPEFLQFVVRLACELRLSGVVDARPAGLHLEIEGDVDAITEFRSRLALEAPEGARLLFQRWWGEEPEQSIGFRVANDDTPHDEEPPKAAMS